MAGELVHTGKVCVVQCGVAWAAVCVRHPLSQECSPTSAHPVVQLCALGRTGANSHCLPLPLANGKLTATKGDHQFSSHITASNTHTAIESGFTQDGTLSKPDKLSLPLLHNSWHVWCARLPKLVGPVNQPLKVEQPPSAGTDTFRPHSTAPTSPVM